MNVVADKKHHLLCRTCLRSLDNDYYNILENMDVLKNYVLCTSLKIDNEDKYPKNICGCCYYKLQYYQKFRQQCIDSLERFSNLIEDHIQNDKVLVNVSKKQEECFINKPSLSMQFKKDKITTTQEIASITTAIEYGEDTCYNKYSNDLFHEVVEQVIYNKEIPANNMDFNSISNENFENIDERATANGEATKDVSTDNSDFEIFFDTLIDDNIDNSSYISFDALFETVDDESAEILSVNPEMTKKVKHIEMEEKTDCNDNVKSTISVFSCDICAKAFKKASSLEAHLRIHQGLKAYGCHKCEKQFSRSNLLREHIQQQQCFADDVIPTHSCTYEGCERIYTQEIDLIQHINEYHLNTKNYICEICGKIFKRMIFLSRHRVRHLNTSDLPFECNDCGKRFSNKTDLRDHLYRHAGMKNFLCSYCGQRKTTKAELNAHMNMHIENKSGLICSKCNQEFKTVGILNNHMRTVHIGVRDYGCRFCGQRFAKALTLKHHEMRHTGERPFQCSFCNRKFIQEIALKNHLKVHLNITDE